MEEEKPSVSKIRDKIPKKLFDIVVFVVDVPLLEVLIILRDEQLCDF